MPENHALVFGATGLIGWSVVNQLLSSYPVPQTFASVTAVSNRPVDASRTFWPESSEIQTVSGVNLQNEDVTGQLKTKIDGIERTTHVFYFGKLL
jgi:uncharacterized protein YbjT (DUF2867 family)